MASPDPSTAEDTPFHSLASAEDWTRALDASDDRPVVIFKHSSACPISARANDEMTTLAEEDDVPVYRVVVQQSRDVSNAIEDDTGLRHETPQVIVLHGRSPVFDASHGRVKADTVRNEL